MENVKFKKLNAMAIAPSRGSVEAAGWDLYAAIPHSVLIQPGESQMVGTGISLELPSGTFGGVFARSGLACKHGLRPANCVGVIDSDYRGEVKVVLYNDSDCPQLVEPGERIAQLILLPYIPINLLEAKDLSDTERGEGGFASTGLF